MPELFAPCPAAPGAARSWLLPSHGAGEEGFEYAFLGHTQGPGGDPALFINYEGGGGRLWRDVLCNAEQDAAGSSAGLCDAETAFKGGGGQKR
jgi:hypothetical protein